ncbi:MAG: hypothetical protein M5R41_14960 [Bacteroidia bacterium]|nr:hypothetical protein [Bacteroidia bacterium]
MQHLHCDPHSSGNTYTDVADGTLICAEVHYEDGNVDITDEQAYALNSSSVAAAGSFLVISATRHYLRIFPRNVFRAS